MNDLLAQSETVYNLPLYLSAFIILATVLLLSFFCDGNGSKLSTKSITYAGIAIALSTVLSLFKIFTLPQGGTITLASLLPLFLYAFVFGTKKGVFAGAITGIISCLIDPFVIHPAQFFLDYPIAFGAMGLIGLFNKTPLKNKRVLSFVLGVIISSVIRYACHVLSGVFAFSSYSTLTDTFIYSLAYNAFVFVDMAIAVIIGAGILSSKKLVNFIFPKKKPSENKDGTDFNENNANANSKVNRK